MTYLQRIFPPVSIVLFICLGFLLANCEIGLGSRVSTGNPEIGNSGDENLPGSYLQGSENIIWFEVEQDVGIDSVYMEVEYIDLNTGEQKRKTVRLDQVSDKWFVNLDTTDMADGKITAWVTAIDIFGNKSTTTGINYIVKNLPPQIEMTIPSIKGEDFDNAVFLDNLGDNDPLFVGFDLMGLASDNYGISLGWPKIMFWPADETNIDSDGLPIDLKYRTWRSMVVPKGTRDGVTATRITWPMVYLVEDPSAEGGWCLPKEGEPKTNLMEGRYRFRIEAKDLFGNLNYYPDRKDNTLGTIPPEEDNRKKYIEINYTVSDIPIARITDAPQFYNGIGDFKATATVTASKSPLKKIVVFLAKNQDGAGVNEKVTIYNADTDPPLVPAIENGKTYNLTITLEQSDVKWSELQTDSGDLYLHILATDENEKDSPTAFKNFIFDTVAPTVIFDRPDNLTGVTPFGNLKGGLGGTGVQYEIYRPLASPKWVTGTITIGGEANDVSDIYEILYHIGDLGDDKAASGGKETTVSKDDLEYIYVNAKWKDSGLGVNNNPKDGWNGSRNFWSYTYNFNNDRDKGQEAGDFGFFDSNGALGIEDDVTGTVNRQRFYLPFYVKVSDRAGNVKIVHYKLAIDPDIDIPQVDITYPPQNSLLGGEVRLSGVAKDNYRIDKVLIRIKKEGMSNYYIPAGAEAFYNSSTIPIYPKPKADGKDDTDGWFAAEITGAGTEVYWSCNINSDGRLDPGGGNTTAGVSIEVRAIDVSTVNSNGEKVGPYISPAELLNVTFSSGVPTISVPKIIDVVSGSGGRYYDAGGIRTSGTVKISMIVRGADPGFSLIRTRINGSGPNLPIGNPVNQPANGALPEWKWKIIRLPDEGGNSRPVRYELEIELDTLMYAGFRQTDTVRLEVTAEDTGLGASKLSKTETFTIEADNFYPFIERIDTHPIAVGTDFALSGEARDYIGTGSVLGLERMLIYFEEANISYANNVRAVVGTGKFLGSQGQNITGTMTTYRVLSLTAASTEVYQNANSASIVNNPFPAYSISGGVGSVNQWKFPNAIVIDKELAGNAQIWSTAPIKDWQATVDTTKFPDGPLMVHYVIMDEAGNASHYQKPVYIENNKPRILSVNLGTDINGDGTVTPWTNSNNPGEYRTSATTVATTTGYDEEYNKRIAHTPAFRARNNRLAFDISTAFGNGQKYYRVSYITEGSVISASEMRIGSVYRIVTPGNTEWRQCGAQLTERDTTFVASGRDEKNGGGTVRVLNEVVSNVKSGAFSGNSHTITITDFTGISDSSLNASGDIGVPNDKLFIIKVYDSAVSSDKITGTGASGRFEENQLAHAILVAMNLDNADRKVPKIEIAPFGQKFVVDSGQSYQNDANKKLGSVGHYNENMVMSGTIRQGYVQYAGGSGAPDISGQVKFLGRAEDNQRIKEITATISNFNGGNAFTVAKEGTNGLLESNRPLTTGMGTGNNAWYFNIIEQHLTLDYGHVLNWEFAWDSSEITNQVGTATVTLRINDCKTGTPNAGQSQFPLNIAPYIAEVVTDLSGAYVSAPSAFARSANGWYPVREGRDITIRGFNLGSIGAITTSSNSKVTLSDGTTTTNLSGVVSANATGETVGKNKIMVNTGTVATSGALVVTVNGIASLNNRNNNSEPYNQEPNGVNNNTLTDDRNLYVWTTGSMVPQAVMTGPFMRMGADAKRYISYGYYTSTGIFRLQKDNTTNDVESGGNINRFLNTAVSVDSYGDWYVAASNMTVGSYYMNIIARAVTDTSTSAGHNNRRVLSPMTIDGQTDMNRYKIPRIAIQHTNSASPGTDGKASRIYVSYGDSLSANHPVIFHLGTRGSNGTANWGGNFAAANGVSATTRQIVASDDAAFTYAGSIYTAVGYLSSGMPVIAWYDRKTPRLVFSWGRNPVSGTAYGDLTDTNVQSSSTSTTECNTSATGNANYNYWQANAVVVDTGKGSHVDMAVDGHNNIHLAYYDSNNGGLYYALIPSDNGTTSLGGTVKPNPGAVNANVKKVKVDTFLAVGTKLMLNVRNEGTTANPVYVPYISYFHGAFTETPNSIRVAWLKHSPVKGAATGVTILPGSDDNDCLTGNWEVMTVPAETIPVSGEFICNGVPGVAGTAVAPNITMTDPSSTAGAGTLNSRGIYMNKSILLGYKTDTYYEGAVLKADLTKVMQ